MSRLEGVGVKSAKPENYGFKYHFFVSYTTREEEVKAVKTFLDDGGPELEEKLGFGPIFMMVGGLNLLNNLILDF